MSERLRLEAEFRDRGVQSGIRKIGTELEGIKQTPGMTQATKWLGEVNQKANGLGAGRGLVTEFMTGLALGGLSAATSVAGLVKTFGDLANRTAGLKEVSRQTGLTLDQVNQLQRAGERLYIDPAKMTAGLETLSGKMFDFKNHMGDLYGELSQRFPDFARKLSLEKPQEQIKDIFAWLAKIDDPQLQRRWTEAFMGDGELSRLLTNGGADFAQAMRDAAGHAARMTPELQAQAKAFHDAQLDFRDTLEDAETAVGPTILKGMTAIVTDFRDLATRLGELKDWWDKTAGHPAQMAKDVGGKIIDAAKDEVTPAWLKRAQERQSQEGLYTKPQTAEDLTDKLTGYEAERDEIRARLDKMRAQSRDSSAFDTLHQTEIGRVQELQNAIGVLKSRKDDHEVLRAPVPVQPTLPTSPEAPPEHWWTKLFHRSSFEPDQADFKTLFRQASFSDGSQTTGTASLFGSPSDIIAEGTKQGVLAAFREMMAQKEAERVGAAGGIQNAAYTTFGDNRSGGGRGGSGSGSGAIGDPKGLFEAIAQAEGTTKDGFNTTLGYGKWGKPDKPLTEMTLDEVKAFGLKERQAQAATGMAWEKTSSANGKFQIVGTTMMEAAKALGLDPSKTKFDGPTQEAMAAWIAKTQGLSAWEGFKSHPAQLAEANRSLKSGDLHGDTAGGGIAANAVDNASKLLGMGSSQVAQALGKRMSPGQWCADFVNGALQSANVKGSNSSLALSFKAWGRKVLLDDVKKGDVLVEDHGGGHGHAGLATGNVRRDASGRVTGVEMISGNHGHRVGRAWERPDELAAIRRAPEPEQSPRRQLNLPEVAAKAAPEPQTFKHEGGASIDLRIRHDGSVKSSTAKTHGLVTAVNLSRGQTMLNAGTG